MFRRVRYDSAQNLAAGLSVRMLLILWLDGVRMKRAAVNRACHFLASDCVERTMIRHAEPGDERYDNDRRGKASDAQHVDPHRSNGEIIKNSAGLSH